ncbi:MAG: transcriptional regulator, MarR/EmrR family [Frankiales bacterium]|nr:transcriptional regulator, MarR/EmrR family [Frankiales bacterium]
MSDTLHPAAALDDTVHQRARLGILAILSEVTEADVTSLKNELGLTDGNLGRHLQVLAEAGLVTLERSMAGSRPRTRVRATRAGTKALREEVDALRALLRRVR